MTRFSPGDTAMVHCDNTRCSLVAKSTSDTAMPSGPSGTGSGFGGAVVSGWIFMRSNTRAADDMPSCSCTSMPATMDTTAVSDTMYTLVATNTPMLMSPCNTRKPPTPMLSTKDMFGICCTNGR